MVTLQESQITTARLKAQQEHQLWLQHPHLAPLWLRIPCHRASTSLSSFHMDFRFMTHQDLQGRDLIPKVQGLCEKSKKGMFPGCPPGQSRDNVQFKKSIFSAGNLNHLPLFFCLFFPFGSKRYFFLVKVSQEEGKRDARSRQQSVANLMHIQNGNTASWWDCCYFVFIKILISVSLLLLFVFFVCLFEKQTILPAPVVLWVWVLLYTYLFCSAV